jgi:hypothetical protein
MDRILRQAVLFLFAGACSAFGQSTEGKLTVTATVLTSVSLVIHADGTQRIVIANASDPADNVSTLTLTNPDQRKLESKSGSEMKATTRKAVNAGKEPGNIVPNAKGDWH